MSTRLQAPGCSSLCSVCPCQHNPYQHNPAPCSQEYGGSEIRPEATGYGAVLFVENVLKDKGESLKVQLYALVVLPLAAVKAAMVFHLNFQRTSMRT